MRLSGQFEVKFFFTKKFKTDKNANQTKIKYQNKDKRTKNNKGNNFSCAQNF